MKHPSSIKVLKSTMLIAGVLLVGCKDKNLFEKVEEIEIENNESLEVETQSFQISEVIVTADSRTFPVKSIITFEVFAETEALFDGPQEIAAHNSLLARVNISALPELKLESSDPEILYIPERESMGIARKAGTVTVYAHFRGVQSAPLRLEILPELTSCGEIDDTNKTNSKGACLKVVKGLSGEAKDKLFTSSPSIKFLGALNYISSDTSDNVGKTYANTILGGGRYAPKTTFFGLFRQDGQDATLDGTDGQYDRYCQHLGLLEYLNRNDWRRVTGQELVDLFHDHGDLFQNYGFFNKAVYWTSSQVMPGQKVTKPFEFYRMGLHKGGVASRVRTKGLAASCVSVSDVIN
ncbi:hypothetical protein AB6D33_24255 [Vibrio splendidus]